MRINLITPLDFGSLPFTSQSHAKTTKSNSVLTMSLSTGLAFEIILAECDTYIYIYNADYFLIDQSLTQRPKHNQQSLHPIRPHPILVVARAAGVSYYEYLSRSITSPMKLNVSRSLLYRPTPIIHLVWFLESSPTKILLLVLYFKSLTCPTWLVAIVRDILRVFHWTLS